MVVLNWLKICCEPLAGRGPVGIAIMFFALAGPILLLIGGLLFAVHNPQNLVSGNARLVSVQSNREIVRGISPRLQSLNALRARRPTGVYLYTPIKNLTRSPQRQAWGDRAR